MEENEERVHYLFIDAFLDYVDAETTGEFEDVIRQLNEIIIPKLEEKTSNWDAEPTSTPSLHEL